MNISTKFGVACVTAVVCLLLAGIIGVLQVQDVRAVSRWIFWGLMLLVSALFIFTLKVFWWDLPRASEETRFLAECVAKQKWYVKGASVLGNKTAHWLDSRGWREIKCDGSWVNEGAARLELSSLECVGQRQELTLPIRPGHPNVKDLRGLSYLDVVGFDLVEKPLRCAFDIDLCAYLLLKPQT